MKSSLWHAVAVIAAASFSLVLVAAAFSGNGRPSVAAAKRHSITSVKVSGSSSNPVFTVKGRGLKVPKPNPATSPSNQALCPVVITGNAGFDYGNSFFVIMWDGQPNGTNAALYSAGRYRPTVGAGELDCIGIIVLKHTKKSIKFTFGHGYQQLYASNPRFIENGDVVEVGLGNARFATVVHF
jgi:hypothetical protein